MNPSIQQSVRRVVRTTEPAGIADGRFVDVTRCPPRIAVADVTRIHRRGHQSIRSLGGVSLCLWPGELLVVMGPSGCGKSSLLHIMGLLDQPTTGSVFINGVSTEQLDDGRRSHLRGQEIGFVFQSFQLLPSLTVLQNTLVPSQLAGRPKRSSLHRARALLEVAGLTDRIHHLPGEISGGEMQRVAIARALMNDPKILLCDEPTGNLDSITGEESLALLRSVSRFEERSVLIVTHDHRVADVADRVIHMRDGLIERELRRRGDDVASLRAA